MEKPKKSKAKIIGIVVVALVVLYIIGALTGEGDNESTQVAAGSSETLESPIAVAETEADATASEATTIAEETTTEAETEPNVPREYQSALAKAETYSDMMHMSKQGIYDQLVSEYGEKFSEDAAQYAIDNLAADWNANALAKAETYSDAMHMSKQGIYDQLTSEYGEQFTAEEAQYAVDNLEADYNYNALQTAISYQDNMNMSPDAIHDQLTSEYGEQFTEEEADYAIANLPK